HNNQNKKINFVGITLLGLSISTLCILSEILLKDVTITTKLVLTALIIILISLYAFSYNKVKNTIIDLSILLNKDIRISLMSNFFC
ncbi:MFS transporter, partial [Francisella tularensis subsp. holarctica]|nr:MFS transporter [Francisella tularensis subsp. holarctica]